MYMFILDLGISPYIKCYMGKTLIQGCVSTNLLSFIEELNSHKFVFMDEKDLNDFVKSTQTKDEIGNNTLH